MVVFDFTLHIQPKLHFTPLATGTGKSKHPKHSSQSGKTSQNHTIFVFQKLKIAKLMACYHLVCNVLALFGASKYESQSLPS